LCYPTHRRKNGDGWGTHFSWWGRGKCGEVLGDPRSPNARDRGHPISWWGRGKRGEGLGDPGGRRLEGLYGFGLNGVDLADGDGGDVEVFSACGRAGKAAEHGELADVGERVGDGALHEALDGRLDRRGGGEVSVECGESSEESLLLLRPGEELRVVPGGVSLGHGERPVKEVAHMGEDLDGTAAGAVEVGEGVGRVFQGADSAISQCGKGVAEKISFFVHWGNIAHGWARKHVEIEGPAA